VRKGCAPRRDCVGPSLTTHGYFDGAGKCARASAVHASSHSGNFRMKAAWSRQKSSSPFTCVPGPHGDRRVWSVLSYSARRSSGARCPIALRSACEFQNQAPRTRRIATATAIADAMRRRLDEKDGGSPERVSGVRGAAEDWVMTSRKHLPCHARRAYDCDEDAAVVDDRDEVPSLLHGCGCR
jgi:hypothetical protein